jgi:hypothetical protein
MFFDVEIVFFVVAAAGRAAAMGDELVVDGGARGRRGLRVGDLCAWGAEACPWRGEWGKIGLFLPTQRRRCLGVVEVEDGRICARCGGGGPRRDERGKRSASFLLRTEAGEIGFTSLVFSLSMRRMGGGVYKRSASGHWRPDRTSGR